MSFDLFFQPCRYDGTMVKQTNPFTHELSEVAHNAPLSDSEVEAVHGVLSRHGASSPDTHGCRVYGSEDGASAEIFADGLAEGCMFAIRGAGVTPSLAKLLFEVMHAGNWVLISAGDGSFVIAPSEDCTRNAPPDFGQVIVPKSPDELAAALSGGFDAWREYCDRVFRRGETDR
jgi:hypothetical protein